MIRLKNMTAKPMQLDSRVLHPGMTLKYPDEILSYSSVQARIKKGELSLYEDPN